MEYVLIFSDLINDSPSLPNIMIENND